MGASPRPISCGAMIVGKNDFLKLVHLIFRCSASKNLLHISATVKPFRLAAGMRPASELSRRSSHRCSTISPWGMEIRLVSYPPYHSKYNLIERCWSSLQKKWNGVFPLVHPVIWGAVADIVYSTFAVHGLQ